MVRLEVRGVREEVQVAFSKLAATSVATILFWTTCAHLPSLMIALADTAVAGVWVGADQLSRLRHALNVHLFEGTNLANVRARQQRQRQKAAARVARQAAQRRAVRSASIEQATGSAGKQMRRAWNWCFDKATIPP